mmetsp:Transcript_7158/g.18534  ORF Transcript_7158/g.18534 Transcript_7158/m.18534 type:complete len:453 (+) Transcript_7158:44-1402(+)
MPTWDVQHLISNALGAAPRSLSPHFLSARLNTELYSTAGLGANAPLPNLTDSVVPKHIFTFWHDINQLPDLQAMCIARFRRLNPGWNVYVLYPGIPGLEPPPYQNINADNDDNFMSLAHIADWYRAAALARFGGVWMDATSIVLRPLESWVDVHSTAVQGWTYVHEEDCMENWAFATPSDSEFMRRWMTEFRLAWKVGPGTYCENLSPSIVGGLVGMLPYLTMHAAYRQTRATMEPSFPVGGPVVTYRPSSTNWDQPFGWLARFDFDTKQAVDWLFGNETWSGATAADLGSTPFVKIRGSDRESIGDIYEYAERGSYVAKLLVDDMPPRPPSPPPSAAPSPKKATARSIRTEAARQTIGAGKETGKSATLAAHATLPSARTAAGASAPVPTIPSSRTKLTVTTASFPNERVTQFPTPDFNTIPPPPPPNWRFEGSQPTGQEADMPTRLARAA